MGYYLAVLGVLHILGEILIFFLVHFCHYFLFYSFIYCFYLDFIGNYVTFIFFIRFSIIHFLLGFRTIAILLYFDFLTNLELLLMDYHPYFIGLKIIIIC